MKEQRTMTTKEQVLAAVQSRFAKKEFVIDKENNISVTLRELSRPERDALNTILFICDGEGKPLPHNSKGKQVPDGDEWKYNEDVSPTDQWLSACMEPKFTVEELAGPEWPISLKTELFKAAQEINGITVKEAAGN